MTVQANHFSTEWWEDNFNINPNGLGCVMLDVENPWHKPMLHMPLPYGNGEQSFFKYLTKNEFKSEELPYAKGLVTEGWHMTCRYGFLPNVTKAHVNEIISKIDRPLDIELGKVHVWEPVNNEDYECVVVEVALTDDLVSLWESLGVLPNICTFPYRPHVTLGYFNPGTWKEEYSNAILDSTRTLNFRLGKSMK